MAVKPTIKVTGRLEARESTGNKNKQKYWRIMLKWYGENGKLQRKSVSTGLLADEKGNKTEGHYIYTDALGNRIKPDYLSSQFPIFLERHGLRHIRFHDLRHSCASLLLANGVSIKQIQDWLGHSTFKTTADIYAHLESDSKLAAAAALTWIGNTSLAREMDSAEKPDGTGISDNP